MSSNKLNSVKPVILDMDSEVPAWMSIKSKPYEYIVLDKESSNEDVEIFLKELMSYNNVEISNDKLKDLEEIFVQEEEQDGILISGGVLFLGEEKVICPSCCAGLNDWREIYNSAKNKTSPWLGHDPTPYFEFIENEVVIWSDIDKKNAYYLECSRESLINELSTIKGDLLGFAMVPLYTYLDSIDEKIARKLIERFKIWLEFEG